MLTDKIQGAKQGTQVIPFQLTGSEVYQWIDAGHSVWEYVGYNGYNFR